MDTTISKVDHLRNDLGNVQAEVECYGRAIIELNTVIDNDDQILRGIIAQLGERFESAKARRDDLRAQWREAKKGEKR